jgi:uncharacterized protein (DUF2235 family)
MGKNIVICCDGTANEFAKDDTNVVKLYYALEHDPSQQVTYYHPGLGTMEPAGALTTFTRKLTKLLGMALGYGLSNDILLRMYGLIQSGNEPLVPYAIRMMIGINRAGNDKNQGQAAIGQYLTLADDFKVTMARVECRPWFVGVWDTVSSVGWVENPLKLPYVASNRIQMSNGDHRM